MDAIKTKEAVLRKLDEIKAIVDSNFADGRDDFENIQIDLNRIEGMVNSARLLLRNCEDY